MDAFRKVLKKNPDFVLFSSAYFDQRTYKNVVSGTTKNFSSS